MLVHRSWIKELLFRFDWLTDAENTQLNKGILLLKAFGEEGSNTGAILDWSTKVVHASFYDIFLHPLCHQYGGYASLIFKICFIVSRLTNSNLKKQKSWSYCIFNLLHFQTFYIYWNQLELFSQAFICFSFFLIFVVLVFPYLFILFFKGVEI